MPAPNDSQPVDPATYEQFIRLFARFESRLRAFVRPLVPGREEADETMQETCVVLWRKFAEFDPESDFLAWACTIARFEALKQRRKLARDRHVFSAELMELLADELSTQMQQRQLELQALDRCMQRLTPQQRDLMIACYSGNVRINEVAAGMGRSAASLYKALNRIRAALLNCITTSFREARG